MARRSRMGAGKWARAGAVASVVACAANPQAARPRATGAVPSGPASVPSTLATGDAAVAPASDAGASVAMASPPPEAIPIAGAMRLQGHLGGRPIRAALVRENDGLKGTYRFIGNVERSIEGTVHVEAGGAVHPQSGMPFGDCEFTERNARGFVTATLAGTCEDEWGLLVFRGTRTEPGGTAEEMFFCTIQGDVQAFERYERALLRTPGPAHDCPPLLQVDQVITRPRAPSWVLYRLGWVCEVPWTAAQGIGPANAPLDGKLYRAVIDEAEPTRLLDVGILANDVAPDEEVKLEMRSWSSHAGLLLLGLTRQWKAVNSGGGRDERRLLWLTNESGGMGPLLALPRATASWCCACTRWEDRVDAFRVALDGSVADDLLVRTTHHEDGMGAPLPDGTPTCPSPPDKVDVTAYRLDVARLRFVRATTPAAARVTALLSRAVRLE